MIRHFDARSARTPRGSAGIWKVAPEIARSVIFATKARAKFLKSFYVGKTDLLRTKIEVEVRVLSRATLPSIVLVPWLTSFFSKRPGQQERRDAGSNRPIYLPPLFLLAAQRAFINCESRFRPAGVIPPFFLAPKPFGVVFWPAFIFAQRALAACASLARVAADIPRPLRVARAVGEPPRIEERRFCSVSICRRIETASCKV
jgi:hypothetical protein